ncbi:MAG: hypothetical protein CVV51_02010 [Spirochaetae bacterium HGW-Spirochaetae-7]|jgi:hypothetical protein|nr:MAG: hypothetical protein CVV51_02010 [Spirochaetae bacterium HGW-Spirochaetae-7]
MDDRELLARSINDEAIIRSFYLDMDTEAALAKMDSLSMRITEKQQDIPFNAAVKGYLGAEDIDGDPWILKPTLDRSETLYHRICTLAFLLDHWMGTLSAPSTVCAIAGKDYRAVKVVRNAIQISSYNYMERPFIDWFRMDLINRWMYFDEDRNPNNYLVIRNSKEEPFVVAIDFDKADFEAADMKITGIEGKFGWVRGEKTRFLTLLKPENFDGVPIELFESRLKAMMAIPTEALRHLARRLVEGYAEDPAGLAGKLAANIDRRRTYIDTYFRKMFKLASETKNISNSDDYSMFGASFLSAYGNNK